MAIGSDKSHGISPDCIDPSIEWNGFYCHVIGHVVLDAGRVRRQSPEDETVVDERGQDRPPWRPKIRASERHVHLLDINIVLKVECRDVTLDLLFWASRLIDRHEEIMTVLKYFHRAWLPLP